MKTIKLLLVSCGVVFLLSGCGGGAGEGEDAAQALADQTSKNNDTTGTGVGSDNTNQTNPSQGSNNVAPVISGVPATSVELYKPYSFTPTTSDVNNDTLTFSIKNKPSWAAFNSQTGKLSGAPGIVGVTSNIQIIASDGELSVTLPAFNIRVYDKQTDNTVDNGLPTDPPPEDPTETDPTTPSETDQAPSIGGIPADQIEEGQSYDFTPIASDPEDDILTFAITNQPSWTSFDVHTGRLSGQPDVNAIGYYSDVVISVSDGNSVMSLAVFSITVTARPNLAPVISGSSSATVRQGEPYSFQPNVTDPEGDLLSFTITNKPQWLTFNNATGLLSGTPGTNDVGSFSGIQISVTDGVNQVALPSFNLTVTSTSARLSWLAPTTRADGSVLPFSELSGYRVYSGTKPGNLTLLADLGDASITEYKLTKLPPATHYYAVTSYNIYGIESDFSQVVSKAIK